MGRSGNADNNDGTQRGKFYMKPYQIALQQFGGNRAMCMIGGQYLVHEGDNKLSFRFKMSRFANHLVIEYLPGIDLYKLQFGKVGRSEYKIIEVFEGIYCDQLKEIFERKTGLYLSI